jgi:hypothetical protein
LDKAPGNTLRYDSGSDSGKVPGSDSGKESGMISGKNLGNTLGYDSGSDSGKVPGSNSGKESGTMLGKNPIEHLGKKLGKELPDRYSSGEGGEQDKNVQDKETSLLWVRDIFVHRNIKFIQDRFNKEMTLNLTQLKESIQVEGGDLKESEPRQIPR